MIVIDQFTGTGSTAGFMLTSSGSPAKDQLFVTIDGVSQLTDAYTVSSSLLSFGGTPSAGAEIEVRYGRDEDQNVNAFTGDGIATSFNLAKAPPSNAAALVVIDGVMQAISTYTLAGSTLSFPSPPANGAEIEVRFGFDAFDASDMFTGDGSETTFELSFTANAGDRVLVLIDGVFQHTNAYSMAGRDLTFVAAPANGSLIEVRRLETQPPPFRGACVHSTTAIPGTGIVVWVIFAYDTDGIWNSGSAARLTVPSGVKRCRVYSQAVHAGDGTGSGRLTMGIKKNGTYGYGGESYQSIDVADLSVASTLNGQTPALPVSPGDYFELDLDADDGSWDQSTTWFALDIVE